VGLWGIENAANAERHPDRRNKSDNEGHYHAFRSHGSFSEFGSIHR
jgi:hypothetical protein